MATERQTGWAHLLAAGTDWQTWHSSGGPWVECLALGSSVDLGTRCPQVMMESAATQVRSEVLPDRRHTEESR